MIDKTFKPVCMLLDRHMFVLLNEASRVKQMRWDFAFRLIAFLFSLIFDPVLCFVCLEFGIWNDTESVQRSSDYLLCPPTPPYPWHDG